MAPYWNGLQLRKGEDFEVTFQNKDLPDDSASAIDNQPFAAVITPPNSS